MLEQELNRQSKNLLTQLGESLSRIFDPSTLKPNDAIDELVEKLKAIPSCHETDLDRSNQRICRILEKHDGGGRHS